ncbi:MAG: AmmeMemoRadiSam system protein B [Promethearchaeota archaeon]
MIIKRARLAGSWYPGTKNGLLRKLDECFLNSEFGPGKKPESKNLDERSIIGGVSPHAGISYSGECAAYTYLNLFEERIPDTIIVIGFEHQGYVDPSILNEGEWETPIGNIPIDNELADLILENSKLLKANSRNFLQTSENSLELQMPFIKYCAGDKDVKIVPIKIRTHNYNELEQIADEIANGIKKSEKDIVIVASSDMSHENVSSQKELEQFKRNDMLVIEEFIKLNAKNVLNPENIIPPGGFLNPYQQATICGTITMATLIITCKKLNASKGKMLKYYTSSEKTGMLGGYCVGYFSGIIIK